LPPSGCGSTNSENEAACNVPNDKTQQHRGSESKNARQILSPMAPSFGGRNSSPGEVEAPPCRSFARGWRTSANLRTMSSPLAERY
jgi:hypothetical protein